MKEEKQRGKEKELKEEEKFAALPAALSLIVTLKRGEGTEDARWQNEGAACSWFS